jgi:predicted MFS family arabinose efflux permease
MKTVRPYYALALLVLIYMTNYADRVIIGVLGEPIKADFKINDTQLGLLTGMTFVLFYGVLGIPVGRLADRYSRKWVLATCLSLWSVMTVASGFTASFRQLIVARFGVGIGEAGCTPASHSLMTDVFPPNRRSLAFAIYSSGSQLGIILGTLIGGWFGRAYGWRAGIIAVGVPGLVLFLLFALTIPEPVRGRYDQAAPLALEESPPSLITAARVFFADRLFLCVMIGMSCAVAGHYSLGIFAVPFLIRSYHLDLFTAARLYGLCYGGAGIVGSVIGGMITDLAGNRNRRWYAGLPAIFYAFAGVLLAAGLYQPDYRIFIACLVTGSICVSIALAPSLAVVLSGLAPRMRASGSAVLLLCSTLVGLGLGPPLAGFISDSGAQANFTDGVSFALQCPGGHAVANGGAALETACQAAGFHGLRLALTAMMGFFLLASLIYVWAARYAFHDAPPVAAGSLV